MSELPKGWVETTIGESITLNDKHVRILDDMECGFVPMSMVPTKYGESIQFESKAWRECKKGYTHFKNNDVLLAKITPCFENGKGALVDGLPNGIGAGSTEYFVLRSIDGLIKPKYLHAFVKTKDFLKNCEINMSGSVGHKRVPKDFLLNYPLSLAPLAEQKRIVEKLDQVLAQVDTIKARLDGIPAILKRFRQSVLAAAVSGKLIEEWRGDTPTPALKNIGSLLTDIRYGTSKKCSEESGKTPVLRIPNIGYGKVLLDNLKYADFDDKELKSLALQEGDLLLIRSNGSVDLVGKLAVIESQNLHCLFAGYLIRLRFDSDLVNSRFVALCLQSPPLRQVIELKAKSTSGVNNINTKEISSLEIPVPILEEQTEIVRLVDQYFAFADTIEKQVQKAQQRVDKLTQSILAKAFRGELVPQNPDDEPAGELLKRIAAARAESEALAKAAKKVGKKTGKG